MKKSMIALLIAAISFSTLADVLVYDYAASFKRIDVAKNYAKVKWDDDTYKLDSAKVVSDKFEGFMVIEACKTCSTNGFYMDYSADNLSTLDVQLPLGNYDMDNADPYPGSYAVMYITRKGGTKGTVYRAIGRFYAGMFGAKSGIDTLISGLAINYKKFTEAYGFLSYALLAGGDSAASIDGFMGKDHEGVTRFNWFQDEGYGADFDTLDHAGYGKVQLQKVEEECIGDSVCYVVKNLSGNVVGGFYYQGHCSEFLVDVCNALGDGDIVPAEIAWAQNAPINGTFTLKLNNKLTFDKKEFRFNDFEDAEEEILKDKKLAAKVLFDNNAEVTLFNNDLEADMMTGETKDHVVLPTTNLKTKYNVERGTERAYIDVLGPTKP